MGIDAERQIERDVFCGIDPGREKFGFALANASGVIFAAIVPFEAFDAAIEFITSGDSGPLPGWRTEGAVTPDAVRVVFLGNGTSHEAYAKKLGQAGIGYKLTDERMTTLEARGLYWELHPPKGLYRIIPKSLRTPPRNVDDLAAWAIIKRGLSGQ